MNIHLFSRSFLTACLLSGAVLFAAGCEDESAPRGTPSGRPNAVPAPPPGVPAAMPNPPATNTTAPAPQASAPAAAPPADPSAPATLKPGESRDQMEKAAGGVGIQGQGYGGPGIITTPVSVYFTSQQRIAFEIQIPHQLQLWKLEHHDRNPKDFNEFKKEIIEPCGISLPELPIGQRYIYDPKTAELLVGPIEKK